VYFVGPKDADVRSPLLLYCRTDLICSLIAIGLQNDFVMSAVLAFSACHLAWQTKNHETENLAYYHRGVALKGLHEAISAFSRQNSESILAASMLLSWQATEW
jgi:hypothetical protein